MSLTARALGGCWLVDTNAKITAASARALAAASYQGHPIVGIWRYVFFGPPIRGDLDADELRAITDAGLTLLVVQHCRSGSWRCSGQQGHEDGVYAVLNAQSAGYVTPRGGDPLCLALDLESVQNPGPDVAAHVDAWCQVVQGAGYRPVLYVGFAAGLSPDELYARPYVDRYWSDAGPRKVTTRGFCCKQGGATVLGGVSVDVDHAFPDALGGTLTGLGPAVDVEPLTSESDPTNDGPPRSAA
jgi:hypothetical protein